MATYDYYKKALANVSKPCAFIDVDLLNQNVKDLSLKNNSKKIRIASKSIRSVNILKKILSYSPVYQGIMCFTAEEALYLSEQGFNDLLIAYPVWDSNWLKKLLSLTKNNQTVTLMIDSVEHAKHLEKIAKDEDHFFLVCIDIDLSSNMYGIHFGVHRSPIKTTEQAIALIDRIASSPYLRLDGVMGYEAQIAGVTDNNPTHKIKNKIIRHFKRRSSRDILHKRKAIIDAIKAKGITLRLINGGGTGSLHQTTQEEHITEVTVGSGFFNPHLFDYYNDLQLQPALLFAIEITRIPSKHLFTCLGGGYIASGATGADRQPTIHLPKGAKLTKNEGAGEVQTPIFYDGEVNLKHGDPIFLRHSKAGELCERFNHIYLIKDGEIIDKINTYRGDGKCFL